MPAIILQNPRSPVILRDPRTVSDPREQAVLLPDDAPSDRAVIRAQAATITGLERAISTRPAVLEDTCTACGCPTVDHFGGCALAMKARKPLQTSWPMGVLYGDSHLDVTRAIAYALEYECGPAVQVLYDALGNDERLLVARQLSRVAVSEHLKELAK